MADTVAPAVRSRMMSSIRGKHTQPELRLRQALHAMGFRFRLHAAGLPGKPDLLFPKWQAAAQVNGCFWHGHDCPGFRMPKTRRGFWKRKIEGNRRRDAENTTKLLSLGWRVIVVWECALRDDSLPKTARRVAAWLRSRSRELQIRGQTCQ